MRIAIIGLGRMGHALAERLLDDGHQVSGWNRSPGRAAALVEYGRLAPIASRLGAPVLVAGARSGHHTLSSRG